MSETPVSPQAKANVNVARETIERLLPEESSRVACMRILTDAIRAASATNAKAWEITLFGGGLRMNVWNRYVISVYPDGMFCAVGMDSLTQEQSEIVQTYGSMLEESSWRDRPTIAIWVPAESAAELAPVITPAMVELIRAIGAQSGQSPYWRFHSTGVIDYLRSTIDDTLPQPPYEAALIASIEDESLTVGIPSNPIQEQIEQILDLNDPDKFVELTELFGRLETLLQPHVAANGRSSMHVQYHEFDWWVSIPWLGIFDHRESWSIDRGVFVFFLIRADRTGAYLTLAQGKGVRKGGRAGRLTQEQVASLKSRLHTLEPNGFVLGNELDLRTSYQPAIDKYARQSLAFKFYGVDEVPDDAIIVNDVNALVSILDEYVTEKSQVVAALANRAADVIYDVRVNASVSAALKSSNMTYTDLQTATFISALQSKGFVILSGISGTGKTKLVQSFATVLQRSVDSSSNLLFLPVRPDWRDSKSLLGYYNPLTNAYEWTPFLRFLEKASQNYRSDDPVAWFVVLDEMNLAHVEYYFADLLSVLESGRDEDGWTREAIKLGYPDTLLDTGDLPPREMTLPPNLYVVGTVNIDETTHAFSPKVLDRAFSIELVDVDFTDYPPAVSGDPFELTDEQRRELLRAFTRDGRFHGIDKREIADYVAEHPHVRNRLQRLNAALRPYTLHFGYRVFDEIVTFLICAEDNGMFDDLGGPQAAFDAAVLMKVLPKFHGTRGKLEEPLRAILAWCLDPDAPIQLEATRNLDYRSEFSSAGFQLPATAGRTWRMLRDVTIDGFTAFG